MKRLFCIVVLLLPIALALPAHADMAETLAADYGMSAQDARMFVEIVDRLPDMPEAEIQALLLHFLGEKGTIVGSRFSSPQGFALTIPEGWGLEEGRLGASVMLTGARDASGFAPTISLMALTWEEPQFDWADTESMNAYFAGVLTGYQFVKLDTFEYQGDVAHELVCVHGESEDALRIQYQLFFTRQGNTYVVTLTTSMEETLHESALAVYDAFISSLEILQPENQGAQPSAQPSEPPVAPSEGYG